MGNGIAGHVAAGGDGINLIFSRLDRQAAGKQVDPLPVLVTLMKQHIISFMLFKHGDIEESLKALRRQSVKWNQLPQYFQTVLFWHNGHSISLCYSEQLPDCPPANSDCWPSFTIQHLPAAEPADRNQARCPGTLRHHRPDLAIGLLIEPVSLFFFALCYHPGKPQNRYPMYAAEKKRYTRTIKSLLIR